MTLKEVKFAIGNRVCIQSTSPQLKYVNGRVGQVRDICDDSRVIQGWTIAVQLTKTTGVICRPQDLLLVPGGPRAHLTLPAFGPGRTK